MVVQSFERFAIFAKSVKWLDRATANQPTIQPTNIRTTKIKYQCKFAHLAAGVFGSVFFFGHDRVVLG